MKKLLDILISILLLAMIALVGYVAYAVYDQHRQAEASRGNVETFFERIEAAPADENGTVHISREDLKLLADSTINENSNVMDINNFISIMLTLITLCLTCSAIIPYVVAKFISESKIKDTVEDLYAKDKERTDRQYHQSVEKLEVAEAHISRMIAYNLKKMDSIRKGIIMTPHASYDYSEHAVWTIGWASKALIRYIRNANANNVRPNEVSKFCAECVSYICDSTVVLASIRMSGSHKDKALRAVCDALDALFYYNELQTKNTSVRSLMVKTDVDKLCRCAVDLYLRIDPKLLPSALTPWPSSDNMDAIATKSKYEEYMKDDGKTASRKFFKNHLTDFLIKNS